MPGVMWPTDDAFRNLNRSLEKWYRSVISVIKQIAI